MKIDISNITKVEGAFLNIEFNEVIEELNFLFRDFVFDDPVQFNGQLVNVSGVLKLSGQLNTRYTTICYRCLRNLEQKMDVYVREDLIRRDKCTDCEAYTYEGNYLEIDKILKDNIILNLPMRLLCKDDCKGLCPICGSDLNERECDCREDKINMKMEVLKNFFKG